MKKIVLSLFPLILLCFSFVSYLFVDPNFFYLKSIYTGIYFSQREIVTTFYVFLIITLFFLYFYIYRMFYEKKISKTSVVKLIFLSCLILILSYPAMLSFDMFNYIATAKVSFLYHENPYIVMPIEFNNDSILRFMHAPNKVALYGPVWIILTFVPSLIGFSNFLIMILGFKVLVATFYFLTLLILWKLSRDWAPVLLFALSPLVLIETFVSGHNDIVMIFLVLFSFYLLLKRSFYWSVLFLFLSILIKFATLFLVPLYLYLFYEQIRNRKVELKKIYFYAFFSMLFIFFLSSLRGEIYPWYAIWFLPFSALLFKDRKIVVFSFLLSLGLMLRYVPFMLIGTHFGPAPMIRIIVTILPFFIFLPLFTFIFKRKSKK